MNNLRNLPEEKNSNSTDLSIIKYIMMEMRSVYKPLMLTFSFNPFVMIASELWNPICTVKHSARFKTSNQTIFAIPLSRNEGYQFHTSSTFSLEILIFNNYGFGRYKTSGFSSKNNILVFRRLEIAVLSLFTYLTYCKNLIMVFETKSINV